MNILALECSTSAAKALIFDTSAGVRGLCTRTFGPSAFDGRSQRPREIYRELIRCGREAIEQTGARCDAVTLTGTWHSLLLCDGAGAPFGNIYLWSDLSAAPTAARFAARPGFARAYYAATGCVVHATYPFFKYIALRKSLGLDGSEQLYAQEEYLFEQLTGVRAVTRQVASGSGFLNLRTRGWDDGLLEEAGVSQRQLGMLCGGNFSAPLKPEAAGLLGLAAGTPVFAGGADGGMTQLGCDAQGPGIMTLSVGTSAALRIACRAPLLPDEMVTWCYVLNDHTYIAGAATNGAGNCVNRFSREYGVPVKELDALLVRDDFARAPVYLPFVFGERSPGWRSAPFGGFSSDGGTLAERYYAVLEGILFNLFQCYLPLCRTGVPPKEIRLSGGIVNCPYWLQMCADIFGCEISAGDLQHASMLGGVSEAARACGEDPGSLWKTRTRIVPNPDKRAFYQTRFAAYRAAYEQTHGDVDEHKPHTQA